MVAVAALLVPVGVAIIDSNFKHFHQLLISFGFVFALAPALAVILAFLFIKGRHRYHPENPRSMSFFKEERTTVTTTDSIVQGEPTSVDFEDRFNTLLAKTVTDKRRLLIVLDNLDRVGEEDARSVLATMQTFTSSTLNRSNDAWRKRVWTLIPYDKIGLNRLWALGSAPAGVSHKPDESFSTAFLDKLFEVVFVTPPLVLSEWRNYLAELLSDALLERRKRKSAALFCYVQPILTYTRTASWGKSSQLRDS